MGLYGIQSHHELLEQYNVQFNADLRAGKIAPFVYPYESLGIFVLIAYHFIPHRKFPLVRRARLLVFLFIFLFELSTMQRCRTPTGGKGFGLGIVCGWGIVWSAATILFADPQRDFQRIVKAPAKKLDAVSEPPAENGSLSSAVKEGAPNGNVSQRQNGALHRPSSMNESKASSQLSQPNSTLESKLKAEQDERGEIFVYQPHPDGLASRLDWIVDLMFSFRGLGWNWRFKGLAAPPRFVQAQLERNKSVETPEVREVQKGPWGHHTCYTRSALIRRKVITCIICYFLLDVLKVVMMRDPYFWGLVDRSPPAHLPDVLRHSQSLTRSYRLVLSLTGVVTALNGIFAPCGLLFVGLLGPNYAGVRSEPWLYPDLYGGFSTVLDRGLAGWWGGWWHQIFRFGFSAPSNWIMHRFDINPRSTRGKTLQLFMAFTLSGFIHGCGSYTQLPATRPVTGPFLFFLLQAFGITMQTTATNMLEQVDIPSRSPRWLRRAGNLIYVLTWFYYVAPLLTNDFARGGVWLFEPVPVSPLRALGFGVKGDSWWCWGGIRIRWSSDDRWWRSGWTI